MAFKKIITIMMATILIFTASMPASMAATTQYKDTKSSDWYYSSLGVLSKENIITGFPDGTFKGKETLNIDQYIAILCRLTKNDVGNAQGYWAQNYIDLANKKGWLDGMGLTTYNKPINRYQASRLTAKALALTEAQYPSELAEYKIYVKDYGVMPVAYKNDVLLTYALGLTTGYPDGEFKGLNTLTRAEAAVISHRVFDPKVRKMALSPSKTEELVALFAMPSFGQFAALEGEVALEGNMLMFAGGGLLGPIPMNSTGLAPNIANISQNVLVDGLIALSDGQTTNLISAGYNYGIFNVNLLSADNESLVILTSADGSKVITLDLVLMQDADGHLKPDASDLILLVCKNIDFINGEAMHAFIMTNYNNRATLPSTGISTTIGSNDLLLTALVHDHNVIKVAITVN